MFDLFSYRFTTAPEDWAKSQNLVAVFINSVPSFVDLLNIFGLIRSQLIFNGMWDGLVT